MRIFLVFALILLSNVFAFGKELQGFVIAVGTSEKNENHFRNRCHQIHIAIAQAKGEAVDVNCVWLKENALYTEELSQKLKTTRFSYLLEYREFKNKKDTVRFVNLHPEDAGDFHQVGWNIVRQENLTLTLSQVLRKSFESLKKMPNFKMLMVAAAHDQSKRIEITRSSFIDKEFSADISPRQAYEIFIDESEKNKDYMRAGVEMAVALGLGAWGYYLSEDEMKVDWDFPTWGDSIKSKIDGSAYRFDDNSFVINRDHAFAGMIYYQIARSSGLNTMESFLVDLAGSTIWEAVVEYREVLSLNDQVVTVVGGFVIGEALFQISNYLRAPGQNLFKQTIGSLLNFPSGVNSGWDKFRNNKNAKQIAHFKQVQTGHVEIGALYKYTSKVAPDTNRNAHGGFLKGEIVSIPMYEDVGQFKGVLKNTAFSDFLFEGSFKDGADEYLLLSKVAFAAYYEKNLGRDGSGNLQGYNFWVGPASGVTFQNLFVKQNPDEKLRDFQGTVHVLGGMMRVTGYKNGFKLTTDFEIYGNFAMIRSFQISAYKEANGPDGLYDVLAQKDYYYAVGSTTRGQVVVEYGNWGVGFGYSHNSFSNVDDYYRNQELVTKHLELSDTIDQVEAFVSYKISKNFGVRFSVQRIRRGGEIKNFKSGSESETKMYGHVYYSM